MRSVLVLLLLASPAAALTLDDPQGDAEVQAFVTASPPMVDAQSDLLRLELVETPRHVEFRLTAGPIPEAPDFEAVLEFDVDGRHYTMRWWDTDALYATIKSTAREGRATTLPVALDDDTRSITVAKQLLRDGNGDLPRMGTTLTIHEGYARGPHIVGGDLYAIDTWDDVGAFTFTMGNPAADTVLLTSPAPERTSNGAATTYAYNVTVRSLVEHDVTVHLEARDAPASWNVSIPAPRFDLAAGDEADVPVLVQVPFAHQHGTYQDLDMVAVIDGTARTSMALGVEYTQIPQPAGHHQELWFHVAASDRESPNSESRLFFSTLDDHPVAVDEPLAGFCTPQGATTMVNWHASFVTPVSVGFVPQPGEPAVLEIPFDATRDLGEVQFNIEIGTSDELYQGRHATPINAGLQTIAFELEPSTERIEAEPQKELELHVTAYTNDPLAHTCALTGMLWAPGATMHLPLLEYHEVTPEQHVPTETTTAPSTSKDAPGVPPAFVLATVFLLARRR